MQIVTKKMLWWKRNCGKTTKILAYNVSQNNTNCEEEEKIIINRLGQYKTCFKKMCKTQIVTNEDYEQKNNC